jgi:hypothetical protein
MKRLTESTVRSGCTGAIRRAGVPTRGSPEAGKCTAEGVNREPSGPAISTGKPASIAPMSELVVPRSIPTMRDMAKP